jgi:hypothetical protein
MYHQKELSFNQSTEDGFEMIHLQRKNSLATNNIINNASSSTFRPFNDNFEQEILQQYEREKLEYLQMCKEEEIRLKQMDEDRKMAREIEEKLQMEQSAQQQASFIYEQQQHQPSIINTNQQQQQQQQQYHQQQQQQPNIPNFSTDKELVAYFDLVEQGFPEPIAKFAVEAYCGDNHLAKDFIQKLEQLKGIGFSENAAKEALLLTNRDLNQSIDYLTGKDGPQSPMGYSSAVNNNPPYPTTPPPQQQQQTPPPYPQYNQPPPSNYYGNQYGFNNGYYN